MVVLAGEVGLLALPGLADMRDEALAQVRLGVEPLVVAGLSVAALGPF